jgi:Flp pilus assembly pilin Flp
MFRRFIFDDHGQDLIEYGLLGALIAILGIVAWANVGSAIFTTYGSWDTNVQNVSATTPDPIGAGS